MAYEAVIGLECHIQVASRSKMFCGCPATFGAEANSNVCPVCLGLPGALPVANAAAIDATLRLGLALGCDVRERSVFARKNYFYPDMPKNYQISQYDRPLCEGGSLTLALAGGERTFALTRIHIEEDTGKSFHPERHGDRRVSRVDFNRAGVPLMELVTEPIFHAADECAAFLLDLRRLVRWLGISGGDMEKGQLRCDANVSLRPIGETALGTKTELKNLNSIKGVEKGVVAEIERQRKVLESGGRIEQATLLYDADHDKLAVMRTKEHAHDYRYFPEPDLPIVQLTPSAIAAARAALPELPWQAEARLTLLEVGAELRSIVAADRSYVERFDGLVAAGASARFAARVIANWELAKVNEGTLSFERLATLMPATSVAILARREAAGELSASATRELHEQALAEAIESGTDPSARFTSAAGALAIEQLRPLVLEVLAENPESVAQYRSGRAQTFGFLVGRVMKKSEGRAVAQQVQELLREALAGPE